MPSWLTRWPGTLLPCLLLVALAVCSERSGFDLWLADHFADGSRGFAWAHAGWADDGLHEGAQWLIRLLAGALLLIAVLRRGTPQMRPALYLLACLVLSTGSVALLKQSTNKDCPWDLARYGGDRPYVPLGLSPPLGKPRGHCFPGGHSSAAFGLFGWVFLVQRRRPRRTSAALAAVGALGLLFAGTQWLRGAHFVSHDLWSAAIGWLSATLALPILGPTARRRSVGVRQAEEAARVR